MVDNKEPLRSALADRVQRIVSRLPGGDAWSCAIGSISDRARAFPEAKPFLADNDSVELYLRNVTRSWALGPGRWPQTPPEQEPRVVVHSMSVWDQQVAAHIISPTKRTADEIHRLRGQVIEGTAESVPISALDSQGRYRPAAV
jgi:hypothetical protein